ncbi:hypothetical protein GTS_48910 [Gandjariella thermophila]|uniref:Uncharacterized protein n=1 Tax=Gandjariella thermophila TaxID=1931992 RepID=A0A4D4JF26_9PSEU|nr:hypothetical protein GTS_48910 [Gandjariella thermophila]
MVAAVTASQVDFGTHPETVGRLTDGMSNAARQRPTESLNQLRGTAERLRTR